MKLANFFRKFEIFANSPDAIAKIRELVLNLGVGGKLTDHDEPWRVTPLGEVVRLRRGYDLPIQSRTNGPWPIYAANGPVGFHNKAAVQGPGVVTGRSGSIGKVHFVFDGFWPLNTALYAEAFFGNDPEYVCLLLKSLRLERFSTSTAVPTLNRNVVHKELVRVPTPAEQKRIVTKVNALTALCDRLEAQQKELETRHTALARAALSRFADAPTPANLTFLFHNSFSIAPADLRKSILTLAVQGKLVSQEANDIPAEDSIKTARKEAGLASTELREVDCDPPFAVPKAWRWVTVSDVAATRLGKMLDKEKNRGEAHPYLRNTNVHWFRFELDSIKSMRFERSELAEYRVEPGDVLICEGGHGIARSAVWTGDIPDVMFQKALHRARPLSCLSGHFLTFCLWVYERQGILQRYYTGAGIPHFTGKSLARVCIPLPPLAEQHRIVAKVDQLMALVDELESQLTASRATASKLLDAIVGELTA